MTTRELTPQALLNRAIEELAKHIGGDAAFPFMQLIANYGNHLVDLKTKEITAERDAARADNTTLKTAYNQIYSALEGSNEEVQTLGIKLRKWTDVFGHLGTADEVGNEWHKQSMAHDDLEKAAKAVIERWDTPLWKDVPATAVYIADLRKALETMDCEVTKETI